MLNTMALRLQYGGNKKGQLVPTGASCVANTPVQTNGGNAAASGTSAPTMADASGAGSVDTGSGAAVAAGAAVNPDSSAGRVEGDDDDDEGGDTEPDDDEEEDPSERPPSQDELVHEITPWLWKLKLGRLLPFFLHAGAVTFEAVAQLSEADVLRVYANTPQSKQKPGHLKMMLLGWRELCHKYGA